MLVERLGINPDQCVAFGDGGNDIEMLEYCGLSYAMDNATEAVKQVAKHQLTRVLSLIAWIKSDNRDMQVTWE